MGAILAVFGVNPIRTNEEAIQAMLACSPYRGGARVMRCEGAAIAIQETGGDASLARLGAWIIAFHGFIGNWADLDRQHRFNFGETDTDAHRMGMAYRHLGDKLFEKLRGEYACLIYQQDKEEIQAVRDLIGCRPLFHGVDDRRLFLASEIRQIRAGSGRPRVLNEPMVASYLMSRPIRLDLTLDQQVYRVVPGQVLTLNTAKPGVTLRNTPYWPPPPQRAETRSDRVALAEEFRHLLEQAVSRSLPDTPFGVCLSGGLDSGAVWALTAHLAKQGSSRAAQGLPISRTYPGMPCDESHLIGTMRSATGIREFIEIPVTDVNSTQWFDDNTGRVDGHYGVTGDTIPILSQTLALDGRRVLLTGFGEEWISGSFRYLADDLLSLRWATVLRDFSRAEPYRPPASPRLRRLWQQSGLAGLERRLKGRTAGALSPCAYDPALIPAPALLPDAGPAGNWPLARSKLLHSLAAARSTLVYETNEQLAAHFGVETRQPLHDVDLIEFAYSLPPRCFTEGLREKQLLRRALADLLPQTHQDLRFKASHIDRFTLLYPVFLRNTDPKRWTLVRQGFLREAALRDALRTVNEMVADPAFPSTGPIDRRIILTTFSGWCTLNHLISSAETQNVEIRRF